MSRRKFTADRYKEIERLLATSRGVPEIARALKCSRRTRDYEASQSGPRWLRTHCG